MPAMITGPVRGTCSRPVTSGRRPPAAPARRSARGPGRARAETYRAPCATARESAQPTSPARRARPTAGREIRHTGVVKIGDRESDRTRDAVARLILERGPQTAAALADRLGLSPAGVRRHLDALVADGLLVECEPAARVQRGRGRPARVYALTDAGPRRLPARLRRPRHHRAALPARDGGEAAVTAFAEHRAGALEAELAAGDDRPRRDRRPTARRARLAGAPDARTATPPTSRRRPPRASTASSSASTTARSRTSRPSSPSCARPRPGPSTGARHLRPAPGHHRPRRRRLHHPHPARRTRPAIGTHRLRTRSAGRTGSRK